MRMPFRFVEGMAMADVAFEATGRTLEELFESSGRALTSSMVSNAESISAKTKVEIKLENEDEERLLHDFLQEMVFYKDAESLIFSGYEIKVSRKGKGYSLKATLEGEEIDNEKHAMVVDVKAVSWHMYKVRKEEEWKAFVILDV
jgi:SHS2 domain-containing protein